jgi:predicted HTH domain antitoxin
MTLHIPDDVLKQTGLDERGLLIEVACRLFDAGKLTLHAAGKLAGLSRVEMEDELLDRRIAIYRPTVEDLRDDLRTLEKWRK